MQRLHGQCPGVGSVSRKEDRPEGARDGDNAPPRTVSPSGPPGSALGPVRAQRRGVGGSGYSKAGRPGRASCLQGPGPERYPAAGPNPSLSGAGCAAAPARRRLQTQLPERAGRKTLAAGRVPRGVAEGRGSGRYCSVRESRRMRSSSSSSWRARRRRSSCSCADSSMASRSCSS